MCIHKCYNFRCGHTFFVPGAKVVCDLATVALRTPAPGASADDKPGRDPENPTDQEKVAEIALPPSPRPGLENAEGITKGWPEIKGVSGVCTQKSHGFYSNNIERLCSDCRRERDEERELEEWQMAEATRRAQQFGTEPEREYATDAESMVSASEAETASVGSMKSMISPESAASSQQRKTSSGFEGFMNVFKRS